jgi:CTP synthase
VGDIESLPFLEAIRQMRLELGREHTLFIHVTLVPYIGTAGELKTKPTQHSVKELREIGIQPDILLCRTERSLTHEVKSKIAMFCSVAEEAVINARDVPSIYQVPLALAEEKLDEQIVARLELETPPADLTRWRELSDRIQNPKDTVRIGVVGKYVQLQDSYKSLGEALVHATTGRGNSKGLTASWCRVVSDAAVLPGCCAPSATPAKRRSPSSASAWGCSAR